MDRTENPIVWEENFPQVYTHTSISFLKHCSGFERAKRGDKKAAARIVGICVKSQRINEITKKYPTAVLIPVISDNKLPEALAEIIGLEIYTGVREIHPAKRKKMSAMERLLHKPVFTGKIIKGKQYILVDDVVTQGGTVSELRKYIIINGGIVLAVMSLACSAGGSSLAPAAKNIHTLVKKFDCGQINCILKDYCIGNDLCELTNSQIMYILRFKGTKDIIKKIEQCRLNFVEMITH